jgi:hypothetical protein
MMTHGEGFSVQPEARRSAMRPSAAALRLVTQHPQRES